MLYRNRKKKKFKFLLFLIFPLVFMVIYFVDFKFPTRQTNIITPLVLGESIETKINDKLPSLGLEIENIQNEEDNILIITKSGQTIIFNRNKDINLQLTSLQFIIDKNKMEGRQAKKVDLSFDNPIVIF